RAFGPLVRRRWMGALCRAEPHQGARLGLGLGHKGGVRVQAPRDVRRSRGCGARASEYGGEGGIRTHDTLSSTPHFECGTFNHSATSPEPAQAPIGGPTERAAEPTHPTPAVQAPV